MTKRTTAAVCILLSFMFLFTCIGYAALTARLTIGGVINLKWDPPKTVVITNVETVSVGNGVTENHAYHIPTNLYTKIDSNSSSGTSVVTYDITFHNYSDFEYAYIGIEALTDGTVYDNALYENGLEVGVQLVRPDGTLANITGIQKIAAGADMTFRVTYRFNNSKMPSDKSAEFLLNYVFSLTADGAGAAASLAVIERFIEILEDRGSGGDYEKLADIMKLQGTEAGGTGAYTGNVPGAPASQIAEVVDLFKNDKGENVLRLPIYNEKTGQMEEVDVYCLIKMEDLSDNAESTGWNEPNDGNPEMTIYMTIDPLTKSGGQAEIFAAVFTCSEYNSNKQGIGEWYLLGDIYSGQCTIVSYSGGSGTKSFRTDDWKKNVSQTISVTEAYGNTNAYSYTVESGKMLASQYSFQIFGGGYKRTSVGIVPTKDANAVATLEALLDKAYAIIHGGKYGYFTGSAVDELQLAYNRSIAFLNEALESGATGVTVNASGKHTLNSEFTRDALISELKNISHALKPFKDIIDSIEN